MISRHASPWLVPMLVALLLVATFALGCGEGGSGPRRVGLLVPGKNTSRNEQTIRPNFESSLRAGCAECEVVYRDAGGDLTTQKKLARQMLNQGVDVLVLNPIYSEYGAGIVKEAEEAGVPVVDYGQVIVGAKPDVFVTFDDVRNGELQTEALAAELRDNGRPHGPAVMLNGEPGNNDEHLFQEGARHGLQSAHVRIAKKRYYIPFWQASQARREMHRAIRTLGPDGFAGVYAETDGIAEGAIAAMKDEGVDPSERPTTGRGATLKALRRVLLGEQLMTVYQPVELEAKVSAEAAADLAEGRLVERAKPVPAYSGGTVKLPTILLEPIPIGKSNIEQIVADDAVSRAELCAGLETACRAAGISRG